MNKYAELFLSRKSELEAIVDGWWHLKEVFTDFQARLDELKDLVARCPQSLVTDFSRQVKDIEETLRKVCFIS